MRDFCARLGVELIVERADGLARLAPREPRRAGARSSSRVPQSRRRPPRRRLYRAGTSSRRPGRDGADAVAARRGAAGLAAMAERGPGRLIRPMLRFRAPRFAPISRRRAILSSRIHRTRRCDILRNRIRAELIPMLERDYAPGLQRAAGRTCGEMRSLDDLASAIARARTRRVRSRRSRSTCRASARCIARCRRLRFGGFSPSDRDLAPDLARAYRGGAPSYARGGPSDSIDLPGGWRAEREYNLFRLSRPREPRQVRLRMDSRCRSPPTVSRLSRRQASSSRRRRSRPADASMPDSLLDAIFDAAKIGGRRLVARNFMKGDRIASDRDAWHAQSPRRLCRSQTAARPARSLSDRHAGRRNRVASRACARGLRDCDRSDPNRTAR